MALESVPFTSSNDKAEHHASSWSYPLGDTSERECEGAHVRRRAMNLSIVRLVVRVFVRREDGGERVGRGEDFFGQIEETLEGAAMFSGFGGGLGFGRGGAGEVLVPALHVVVEAVVMAPPARGFALRFVEPADEVEPVDGGETRFGFREILLHTGEH